jgi:hypothetical protein
MSPRINSHPDAQLSSWDLGGNPGQPRYQLADSGQDSRSQTETVLKLTAGIRERIDAHRREFLGDRCLQGLLPKNQPPSLCPSVRSSLRRFPDLSELEEGFGSSFVTT